MKKEGKKKEGGRKEVEGRRIYKVVVTCHVIYHVTQWRAKILGYVPSILQIRYLGTST